MGKQKKKQNTWQDIVDIETVTVAADRFKALGDPTRLGILQFLIWSESQPKAKPELDGGTEEEGGVTIGEIARFLTGDKEITSIISHHIKELRQAGLIVVERDGKKKRCYLSEASLQGLIPLLGVKPITEGHAQDAEEEKPPVDAIVEAAATPTAVTPETIEQTVETMEIYDQKEGNKLGAPTKQETAGRRHGRKEPQPKLTETTEEAGETL